LLWSGTAVSAIDLNPAGFDYSEAKGIGGDLQVGWGYGAATGNEDHALVWASTAASAVDLHQFLSPEFTFSHAERVDGQGNIVGWARSESGYNHAILWQAVPEPATLSLLGMGVFVALLARACLGRRPSRGESTSGFPA
jgi:hypothetical protein